MQNEEAYRLRQSPRSFCSKHYPTFSAIYFRIEKVIHITNMIFEIKLSEFLVGLVIILVVLVFFTSRRKTCRPPGPWALPLLGNVLQLDMGKPYKTLTKWGKKYGPIYSIKMGRDDSADIDEPTDATAILNNLLFSTVILSDAALVRELFSDNASAGRTTNPILLQVTKGAYGVLNTDGPHWDVTRRFTVRTLRDLGFAKNSMEVAILEEVRAVLQMFREKEATPISGTHLFNAPVINALWHIVHGERFQWEIPGHEPVVLNAALKVLESVMKITSRGLIFAPILRFIAPEWTGWRELVEATDLLEKLILETVEEHKAKLDTANPNDFIDHMLKEISETTDPESCFYKELGYKNLVAVLVDLFLAGTETSSNMLSWILLYVSNTQSVQRKLQEEIGRVIGTSRLPSLSDRPNMPYTEAVLSESLRLSAVTPIGNPHRMVADKEFHGYLLSKDNLILVNHYGIMNDPKYWGEEVLAFRPERFLSVDVDQTKLRRSNEALIFFSVGKRTCLGEGFARDTLFLFVTSIFQKFNIEPDEKCNNPEFESEDGILRSPRPFKFIATSRNTG